MARAFLLLLFDIVLVLLAIEDFRMHKIRNLYSCLILGLGAVAVVVIPEIPWIARVLGMFGVSVPMLGLALLFPGSFGGGDIKIVLVCGAFLGWPKVLEGTLLAIFLSAVYSGYLVITQKKLRKRKFAFGPCLSVGYLISSFCLY